MQNIKGLEFFKIKNHQNSFMFSKDIPKNVPMLQCTLDPKSFDYSFLVTLDEKGQGIPNDGEKRGGRNG